MNLFQKIYFSYIYSHILPLATAVLNLENARRNGDMAAKEASTIFIITWFVKRLILWAFLVVLMFFAHFAKSWWDVLTVLAIVYAPAFVIALSSPVQPDATQQEEAEPDALAVEFNRQDAEEVDEDMNLMMYNADCDVSDNTPVIRPRDIYAIQTSEASHIYMDGTLAVHRYEIRCDREIDRDTLNNVTNELQTCINRQSKRFPRLMVDGHAPFIYDICANGSFFTVEIVRYSKEHEQQIKLRKQARIARKLKEANPYVNNL